MKKLLAITCIVFLALAGIVLTDSFSSKFTSPISLTDPTPKTATSKNKATINFYNNTQRKIVQATLFLGEENRIELPAWRGPYNKLEIPFRIETALWLKVKFQMGGQLLSEPAMVSKADNITFRVDDTEIILLH